MFKGFKNTAINPLFNGFPNLNFQMNNGAYGFSGLIQWLDSAQGLNTQSNLGAISSWFDRISGVNWLQPTAGSQPRLITSEASFNNLPCIEFQDSSRVLNLQNNQTFDLPSSFTLAIVCKVTTLQTGKNILFTFGSSSALSGLICLNHLNAGHGFGIYANNTTLFAATAQNDTSKHILIITNNTIMIDGVVVATTGSSYLPTSSYQNMGQTGTGAITGKIAEILVYKQTLSSADCLRLSTNLNTKYAIY